MTPSDMQDYVTLRLQPELDTLHQQLLYLALSGFTPEAKEAYVQQNLDIRTKIFTLQTTIQLLLAPPAAQGTTNQQ